MTNEDGPGAEYMVIANANIIEDERESFKAAEAAMQSISLGEGKYLWLYKRNDDVDDNGESSYRLIGNFVSGEWVFRENPE